MMPHMRNPFCAHAAGRSFHSAVRVSPSCRARDISLSTSRRTSTPHAIPTVHNPHSRCSRSSPRTPHWRSSRGPGGQDWSPCAASVVICGGHFLLPIHVSHSTASRGGTSEPQRVPTRPPASRSGGVSLLIRYHVEQVEGGPSLSGSGRPLARTSAGLARLPWLLPPEQPPPKRLPARPVRPDGAALVCLRWRSAASAAGGRRDGEVRAVLRRRRGG